MSILQAKNITKSYGQLQVLKGVDMKVSKGEIVSIIGASGAGKTTLLQIISTLDKADSGEIFFKENNITQFKKKELARFRNKEIGVVFQFHHLFAEFTALENICIPAYIAGTKKKEAERRAIELLDLLGLSNRKEHKPGELSGGENQRVAIARALINSPSIVFADEPTGNLDSATKKEIHSLFFKLREVLGQTFVIVTHDLDFAKKTDRIIQMKDGIVVRS